MIIVDEIHNGKHDSILSFILEAANARKSQLQSLQVARLAVALRIGDSVRFNEQCGTRYMVGHVGKVTKINRASVLVDLDAPVGRFQKSIKAHISIIDKV
jgi:uncharacterized protein YkvS